MKTLIDLCGVIVVTLFVLAVLGAAAELVSRMRRIYWKRQTRLRTGDYWSKRWSA